MIQIKLYDSLVTNGLISKFYTLDGNNLGTATKVPLGNSGLEHQTEKILSEGNLSQITNTG
jgi:hypothetical protein